MIELSQRGSGLLDAGDTPAFPGVYEAAANVVGGTLEALAAIVTGPVRRAFIPIGGLHHATRDSAAGFCVFNDCGVAIEAARRNYGIRRVAYVDIDAHHGDGVFYAFEQDPDVLFADLHEDGRYLYPGTGSRSETGRGPAIGTKLNIPLPPGAGDDVFLTAWQEVERYLEQAEPRAVPASMRCRLAGRRSDHALAAHGRSACTRRASALRARRPVRWRPRARHGRRRLQPHESRDGLDTRRRRAGGLTMFDPRTLADLDPQLARALEDERARQETTLELIASENYVSPRVLAAQGSLLTNKYADGYPGERHYAGCELADVAERLAIERAQRLFGAGYANVQPYSGSQANLAAYLALLEPGDTLLGMRPAHGGHRTHGAAENLSGTMYNVVPYDVSARTGELDYEQIRALAREHRPKLIVAGFSAYSRVIDWARFRAIADEVGARFLADIAHVAGLIAVGLYPNPVRAGRRHDDHDAQDAAGTARRHDPGTAPLGAHAAHRRSGIPRHAGRAFDARDRRESRRIPGSARARVRRLPAASACERAAHGSAADRARLQGPDGRHGQPHAARRSARGSGSMRVAPSARCTPRTSP